MPCSARLVSRLELAPVFSRVERERDRVDRRGERHALLAFVENSRTKFGEEIKLRCLDELHLQHEQMLRLDPDRLPLLNKLLDGRVGLTVHLPAVPAGVRP